MKCWCIPNQHRNQNKMWNILQNASLWNRIGHVFSLGGYLGDRLGDLADIGVAKQEAEENRDGSTETGKPPPNPPQKTRQANERQLRDSNRSI